MVWAFLVGVIIVNAISLYLLKELRQEITDYLLGRDNEDADMD